MPLLLIVLAACDGSTELGEPPDVDMPDGSDATPDGSVAADASIPPGLDAGDPTPPPGPSRLTVATWNLEEFPRDPGTIDAVRDLVVASDLDLVGIQEITEPEPFQALADALPDHEMVVSFDSRTFTRVGFLYRPGRIVVGEVDRLFTSDRWAFPRSPLMAELAVIDETGATVFDFTFVVVHLKAMVDEESRQRRISAVEQLDAFIRERVVTHDPDVIVAGDFNDELTDAPAENVFLPFLDAPERYRFLTLETERSGGYSYIPFRAMIDHVLVTTDALAEYGRGHAEILRPDITMTSYRDVVSDHRPVVTHFELGAP